MHARAHRRDEGGGKPTVAIFRAPLFNPSETFVRDHAARLRRYRPVFCGLERKGLSPGGAPLIVSGRRERLMLAVLGLGDAVAERLAPERPTLIHAHFGTDGLLALPLAERLGIPLVVTLHGFDVSRDRAALLTSGRLSWMRYALGRQRLFAATSLFLAVSDAVRERALRIGFPAERLVTHYSGVDLGRFAPARSDPEPGLILHVGRLVEKKGTRLLLEAMHRLVRDFPEARLAIIGDGPLRSALDQKAAALGLQERVRFLGALSHADVLGWMRRAWLLAAPSVTARDGDAEGLPTVICEAAAAGLPAVASRHAGIPEAIVDGETGLLSVEGDAPSLAAAIATLLANRGRRAEMAVAARALADRRFDAAAQSARLETYYDEVRLGVHRVERRCV